MALPDFVIRGRQVVIAETGSSAQTLIYSRIAPASIHIRHGRIAEIKPFEEIPDNCRVLDAEDESIIMPGLVDTHVHINEPGRTEWEGFATATRAAAAGGVTTLVDMPLNCIPPTTTLVGFQ